MKRMYDKKDVLTKYYIELTEEDFVSWLYNDAGTSNSGYQGQAIPWTWKDKDLPNVVVLYFLDGGVPQARFEYYLYKADSTSIEGTIIDGVYSSALISPDEDRPYFLYLSVDCEEGEAIPSANVVAI